MALQSNIEIYISGTPITAIKKFTLHQNIGEHHYFELVCRMDVIEKGMLGGEHTGGLGDEAKNFLGEPIALQVMSLGGFSGYKSLAFKGVVTGVNSRKAFNHKNGDVVVISGHSGSIVSDDGPHYASHNDATLSDILGRTFTGYDNSKLETSFAPTNTESLHYSVQHKESSWEYARRLAAQYSEWFYYDGKKLIFGSPNDGEAVELKYGIDLQEFSMTLKPQPNNFKYFTNDYLTDGQHTKNTAEVSAPSGFNGFASDKASTIYAKKTNVWINGYTDPQLKSRLDTQVEQQKKAADQRQVIVKGTSDNPGVGIGRVISIMGETEHYGKYRVTNVTHTSNENGRYQNEFEAVSAEMDVYPLTDFNAIPISDTQTAVVTENSDPEGMGRIRVEFPWQRMMGETTPWLRIVTPHSGGDKGFHFIPEVGEEVLVGFEGGNAERPYVMGSLYHGSHRPQSWKTQKNDIKAMRTRSGHTLEFSDSDGAESITLTDPKGNLIIIDTASETITVNALKNININAGENIGILAGKNISIRAGENLDVSVGKDMSSSIGNSVNQMAKNSTVNIEETLSINAKKEQTVADEITISSNSKNLTLASGKTVDIQSEEKVKLF